MQRWLAVVEIKFAARSAVGRAIEFLQRRNSVRAMGSWRSQAAIQGQKLHTLRRGMAFFDHTVTQKIILWRSATAVSQQTSRLLRHAVAFLRERHRAQCFAGWRIRSQERARTMQLMRKVVSRLTASLQARSFEAWRIEARTRTDLQNTLREAVMCILHRSLTRSFTTWRMTTGILKNDDSFYKSGLLSLEIRSLLTFQAPLWGFDRLFHGVCMNDGCAVGLGILLQVTSNPDPDQGFMSLLQVARSSVEAWRLNVFHGQLEEQVSIRDPHSTQTHTPTPDFTLLTVIPGIIRPSCWLFIASSRNHKLQSRS